VENTKDKEITAAAYTSTANNIPHCVVLGVIHIVNEYITADELTRIPVL